METAPTPQSGSTLPPNVRERNPWSPQIDHANHHAPALSNGYANNHATNHTNAHLYPSPPPPLDPERSLASISLHAHILGLALGASLTLTLLLILPPAATPLWRVPLFLTTLSLFHFLEYYTTALVNPSNATTSAFLLTNGRAYNIAHLCAFCECFIHYYYLPQLHFIPPYFRTAWLVLGFMLLFMGQAIRTTAMIHCGPNFTHLVASYKQPHHILVTDGIYAYLRHPSYFGFFWWGLGTQMVLGNGFCFVGYAVVLWRFFKGRIEREEELLVGFFGGEYGRYRGRVGVGIPFIA